MNDDKKIGYFKKSWLLTRSAWNGLKLDKELLALPVIGLALTLVLTLLLALSFIVSYSSGLLYTASFSESASNASLKPLGILVLSSFILMTSILSTAISAAVIHGALARFKGEDPTIKSSLLAVKKRFGSLAAFALFSSVIGYTLSYIAERIPFLGGRIVAWLAGAAWSIASFLAIPVIVSSETAINPLDATKSSIKTLRKVWGESLILSASTGIFAVLSTIAYFAIITGLFTLAVNLALPSAGMIALIILATIGFLALMIVFSVLSAFIKAAIFHYATTGESPVSFDKQVMRQAFTIKKARRLFRA